MLRSRVLVSKKNEELVRKTIMFDDSSPYEFEIRKLLDIFEIHEVLEMLDITEEDVLRILLEEGHVTLLKVPFLQHEEEAKELMDFTDD